MKYIYKILMNGNDEFIVQRQRVGLFFNGIPDFLCRNRNGGVPTFTDEERWSAEHESDAYKFTDVKEAVAALQQAQAIDRKAARSNEWSEVLRDEV